MTEKEKEELGKKFVEALNSFGIYDIKDITYVEKPKDDKIVIWIVKG